MSSSKKEVKWLINVIKYTIFLVIITIPLTHKELFIFVNPYLNWVKFVVSLLAMYGFGILVLRNKKFLNDPVFITLLVFGLFFVLSYIFSYDKGESLKQILFLLVMIFTYPAVLIYLFNDQQSIRKISLVYLISFISVFVFFIVQYFVRINQNVLIGGIWSVPGTMPRFGSTFWDINHYGAYLSALILFTIGSYLSEHKKKIKIFMIIAIILMLISLWFTSSRSAILGLLVGLSIYGIIFILKKYNTINHYSRKIAIITAVLGVVIIPYIFFTLNDESIRGAFLYRSASFNAHLYLLKVGMLFGLDSPLTGIGAGAFDSYFRNDDYFTLYHMIDPTNYKIPMHNLWLEVFTETGVISFCIFCLFWILLIGGLLRLYLDKNDYYALGLATGLTSYLTAGLMYSYKAEFFWFYVIISACYLTLKIKVKYKEKLVENYILLSKYIIKKRKYSNIFFYVVVLTILLLPITFIIKPLSPNEYMELEKGMGGIQYYNNFVNAIRYSLGNYPFFVRIPTILCYIASLLLLINLSKRRMSLLLPLLLAVNCLFLVFNKPLVMVSYYWLYVVIGLFILNIISMMLKSKQGCIVCNFFRFNILNNLAKHRIQISLVILVLTILSQYLLWRVTYNINQTSIIEASYTKGYFQRATVVVGPEIETDNVRFYCNTVLKKDQKYKKIPCVMYDASEQISMDHLNMAPGTERILVLGKNIFVDEYNYQIKNEYNVHSVRVDYKGYSSLMIDRIKVKK